MMCLTGMLSSKDLYLCDITELKIISISEPKKVVKFGSMYGNDSDIDDKMKTSRRFKEGEGGLKKVPFSSKGLLKGTF